MNRRAQLIEQKESIERELKKLKEEEIMVTEIENRRNFDGYVYIQCRYTHYNGGAGIGVYYHEKDAEPQYPVVKVKVGSTGYAPYKDSTADYSL